MFIDSMSRQPVYEQIVDQVEQMILSGLMRPGEQLPSVRSLSLELSINPNTIQKAYAELDGRGIIYTCLLYTSSRRCPSALAGTLPVAS